MTLNTQSLNVTRSVMRCLSEIVHQGPLIRFEAFQISQRYQTGFRSLHALHRCQRLKRRIEI